MLEEGAIEWLAGHLLEVSAMHSFEVKDAFADQEVQAALDNFVEKCGGAGDRLRRPFGLVDRQPRIARFNSPRPRYDPWPWCSFFSFSMLFTSLSGNIQMPIISIKTEPLVLASQRPRCLTRL